MLEFSFKLNDEPMSSLKMGSERSFDAFSGLGKHVNRVLSTCIANHGPIPKGEYYIFDRQSGGMLGPLRDIFSDKDEWFALYADDSSIDDETFCDEVKRGQFRLHPKGPLGVSQGCITINSYSDFQILRALLKGVETEVIPEVGLECYGKITVC
ncbi:DUF2778 domain-containing protein [Marinomonas fungiae]|uniref:Tlde1 domain-containing protein n=1 Tax=Marinomonas fungiae TaxID=1137284 RepID=A0A0K6IQP0_9GAMM|nr:DUF2778 domain-containing protein [Marinomonas fungiae]CUB05421.1 Protein of unknown function (DUF2778) [Marinomonas fungiae]